MKAVKSLAILFLLVFMASACLASEAVPDPDLKATVTGSSHQMMAQIERIIYGYVMQGGLIERLAK
ncbi:MAG: hypothetical protein IJ859_09060, partial [Synergistaceae bacterium]|nr:hypothetical protein [Synergistaceae bacterium]